MSLHSPLLDAKETKGLEQPATEKDHEAGQAKVEPTTNGATETDKGVDGPPAQAPPPPSNSASTSQGTTASTSSTGGGASSGWVPSAPGWWSPFSPANSATPAQQPLSEPQKQEAMPRAASGPGLFDGLVSTFNDLSKQTTDAFGDFGNTVVNLGTHATKLSTSLLAAEQQWREFFPVAASESQAEERLLSFFSCNLLTSVGPCPGTLFVTDRSLYFVSDAEMEFNVGQEEVDESQYRVSIPFNCVSGMAPKINPKNNVDRFILVATADHYDFWFTGFLTYDAAFANLLAALQESGRHTDSLIRNADNSSSAW